MNPDDILEDYFEPPAEVAHLQPLRKTKEWHISMGAVTLPGPWAEFGVAKGRNIRKFMLPWSKGAPIIGFDSWQGLPEAWDRGIIAERPPTIKPKGHFACDMPQDLAKHPQVTLVKGWFKDTCPEWASGSPWAFISMDADLYSSTAQVLDIMNSRIVPGTVIRFDEYQGYEKAPEHEQKALEEWMVWGKREVEWICRGRYGATCRVTK